MSNSTEIFSLIFFLETIVALYLGFYIIKLNPKVLLNRLFLLIALALAFWSFGFAMANSQSTMATALFWRRFSAIGWTFIISFTLHFFLILCDRKERDFFIKHYYLIYIPSFINLFVFALSDKFAYMQYNLVQIDSGWTNIAVNNIYDYFYYFHYLLYLALSVLIVANWIRNLKDIKKARQAKLIFVAILFAGILGSVIDLTANTYLSSPIPQMAPLFTLFPVWAMNHAVKNYDIFNTNKAVLGEIIISSNQQRKVFNNLSIIFIFSGLGYILFEYLSLEVFNQTSLLLASVKGLSLSSLGLWLFLNQDNKHQQLRDFINVLLVVVTIPITSFLFIEYSATTVWSYSLIIIISSLLFNRRYLLLYSTITSIITQRLIWILKPEAFVQINQSDFIVRIIFILVAFYLGNYVNRVYIAKTKENNYQIEFQKLVSDITFDFINYNQENANMMVDDLLEKLGKFFNVDRTYLFTIDQSDKTLTYANEWCRDGIKKELGSIEDEPKTTFKWLISELKNSYVVCIEDVEKMPASAKVEQAQLIRQNVKSLLSVPVMFQGKLLAFIGMASVIKKKHWTKDNIELLNTFANILASVLAPAQIEKHTRYMAYNDSLTGLPNRFLFSDKVNEAIRTAKRKDQNLAVMFIDLDEFKEVNDTLGHRKGDQLLKIVASNLERVVSDNDIVARFGGDEFMILLRNYKDNDTIVKTAEAVTKIFKTNQSIGNQNFNVTASIGISIFPNDGEDSDTLIKNADIAMYQAKELGKNNYVFCSEQLKADVAFDLQLTSDLRKALENNEFVVHYQPQINLNTNKIEGVEALLRWNHPSRNLIPPGIFIPLAEKSDLINDIGEWVFSEACLLSKKWQDLGLPSIEIAINLSTIQIINPNLEVSFSEIIKKTKVDPKNLVLEITESVAIKETKYVVSVLNKLKSLGLSISVDDFGKEYSSLNRLKQLPIDQIKIDLQFIQGIETNNKDQAIIKVIIKLAKSLGLSVLAEGIENNHQLQFLIENNCDYGQGYYFYRPMPENEITNILKKELLSKN